MNKIKIGIISVGNHVEKNIIPTLLTNDKYELCGFYTRNKEKGKIIKKLHKINYYEKLDNLLNPNSFDVIFVGAPNKFHYDYGLKVLENKINLICEKPFTASFTSTVKLLELGKLNNLFIGEAFMFLYHPLSNIIKEIINNKTKFGTLKEFQSFFGFPHLSNDNFRYKKELGGGALLDAGVYPVRSMIEYLGSKNKLVNKIIQTDKNLNIDISGSALFKSYNNVTSYLSWGFGKSYRNEINLWFDKSIINIERAFSKPENHKPVINIRFTDGNTEKISVDGCNHFNSMFDYFNSVLLKDDIKQKENYNIITQAKLVKELCQKEY